MPKSLPPAPPPPNKDDWDVNKDRYLTEDDGVIPLLLLTPSFLHHRSPPLLSVPNPPCSCHFLLSSIACLRLSFFCHYLHPCQTPHVFYVAPISFLLSGPPAAIISMSSHNLFLPSICITSAILYTYITTNPLPLYITPLYFYISIYPLSLTIYIVSLSLTSYLYIFLLDILVFYPLTRFLTLCY